MKDAADTSDQVIIALRRVIRTMDLHSRTLLESHGLTGPQALILNASPVLFSGSLLASAEAVEEVLAPSDKNK